MATLGNSPKKIQKTEILWNKKHLQSTDFQWDVEASELLKHLLQASKA